MAATLEAVRVGKQNFVLPEGPFRNEPFIDFSRSENARAMRAALSQRNQTRSSSGARIRNLNSARYFDKGSRRPL